MHIVHPRPPKTLSTLLIALLCCMPLRAHDFKVGAIVIDHPYAVPSPAAAVYMRTLTNVGDEADRLLSARTPVATSIELHQGTMAGPLVAGGIELPAHTELRLRHDGPWHLVLVGLKAPLKAGDRFAVTLQFRQAGEYEVPVLVQAPAAH